MKARRNEPVVSAADRAAGAPGAAASIGAGVGSPDGLGARIGRAGLANGLLAPVQGVLALAATAIVARHLDVGSFAAFAVFSALRTSFVFYADLGTGTTGTRFYPEFIALHGRAGAVRVLRLQGLVVVGLTLGLVALVVLATPWLVALLQIAPEHRFLFGYALAALALEEAVRVPQVFLWARLAQPLVHGATLIGNVAQLAGLALAVRAGGGLDDVLLVVLAATLIRGVAMWGLAVRELRRLPVSGSAGATTPLAGRFFGMGFVTWVDKLASYLYGGAFLTLATAAFADSAVVALVAVATEFVLRALSLIMSPTFGLALPAFATVMAAGDRGRQERLFQGSLRLQALLLVPAGVLLVAASPTLVGWVYSEKFAEVSFAVQVLVVLATLEYLVYPTANAVFLAAEDLRAYLMVRALSLVGLVALLPALESADVRVITAAYGGLRVAAAWMLFAVAVRRFGYAAPARFYGRLGGAALAALGAGAAVGAVLGRSPAGSAASVLASATVLMLAARWLRSVGPEEWADVARLGVPNLAWVRRILTRGDAA